MVANVRRIFELMRIHAYIDFIYVTRNLREMLMWIVSDFVVMTAGVAAVFLLAEKFGGLGSWRIPQIVFMLGYGVLVFGLIEMFFGFNVAWISRRIGRGQLDHTLIQPQPLWMAFLTEGFVPFSCAIYGLPGVILIGWALPRLGQELTPAWWLLFLVSLPASAAIAISFSFIWGSLAFWAPVAAEEISTNAMTLVERLKPFPLDGMGRGVRGGLLTLAPAGFVAWFPCKILTGQAPVGLDAAGFFGAALLFSAVAAAIFSRGMRHYAQTGSRRYLSLGHRR